MYNGRILKLSVPHFSHEGANFISPATFRKDVGSFLQQYLYKIQPMRDGMLKTGATEEEKRIVAEHFSYLEDLIGKGVLVMAGRTLNIDNSSFGIVVFKANSDEEARGIMLEDPAVKNMVFRAELYPYRIALLKEENAGLVD
jgi:uncharacterized protein YciI